MPSSYVCLYHPTSTSQIGGVAFRATGIETSASSWNSDGLSVTLLHLSPSPPFATMDPQRPSPASSNLSSTSNAPSELPATLSRPILSPRHSQSLPSRLHRDAGSSDPHTLNRGQLCVLINNQFLPKRVPQSFTLLISNK